MARTQVLITLEPELLAAVDEMRGDRPRSEWIAQALRAERQIGKMSDEELRKAIAEGPQAQQRLLRALLNRLLVGQRGLEEKIENMRTAIVDILTQQLEREEAMLRSIRETRQEEKIS